MSGFIASNPTPSASAGPIRAGSVSDRSIRAWSGSDTIRTPSASAGRHRKWNPSAAWNDRRSLALSVRTGPPVPGAPGLRVRITQRASVSMLCAALVAIVGGCASNKPVVSELQKPVSFTSADGRVTATINGPLRREAAKPTSRKRLEWFLYGPEDEPASVLRRPQGLTCAGGFLYIADQGLPDVLRYDLASRSYHRWISPGDRPTCPVAAAADDAGRVYVADAAKRSIFVFDERGHRQPDLSVDSSAGEHFRPSAIFVQGGVAYIADAGARQIRRFDLAQRNWLSPIASGTGDDAIAMPAGLCMTPRGELLVTDAILGVVHRFDAAGKQLKPIGEYGGEAGQLIRPMGIACTASGVIFVADAGRESLMAFDQEGAFLLEIAGASGDWNGFIVPTGVAVLPGYNGTDSSPNGIANEAGQLEWAVVSDMMRGTLTLVSINRKSPG